MTSYWGIAGFAAVLLLCGLRVPIAIAMGIVGAVGSIALMGWAPSAFLMSNLAFEAVFPYGLSVIPLFVFMGVFASYSGLSQNLYAGINAFVGHRRGGLAAATVGACAVFGAICGSSLATCATLGRVALPEMDKRGYSPAFAGATVAAGGTLGVLIPPSIILVIYGLLTQQSIGALFAAAMIPGLIATLLYMAAIWYQVRRNPALAPAGPRTSRRDWLKAIVGMWDALVLILLVIGGIYSKVFSPTEAAAVGAGAAVAITALKRRLTLGVFTVGISETAQMTGMIFLILIGAALFNLFIEASRLPEMLVTVIGASGLPAPAIVAIIIVFYVVLGCFMDSLSMVLLTVTPVYAIITQLGLDPIWFGVVLVTVAEIGLITPPIGMNLFVIKSISPGLALADLWRGILPFIGADLVRVVVIASLPMLSLWLPRLLGF
ncbi:TRAP transporter large permease [Mesorhizobium sp. UC22_110]|uniref:TRAP transporter large permease n=1 Tax=unclassified Mesorhizobium TaxID=325217 RepID=UPI00366CD37E